MSGNNLDEEYESEIPIEKSIPAPSLQEAKSPKSVREFFSQETKNKNLIVMPDADKMTDALFREDEDGNIVFCTFSNFSKKAYIINDEVRLKKIRGFIKFFNSITVFIISGGFVLFYKYPFSVYLLWILFIIIFVVYSIGIDSLTSDLPVSTKMIKPNKINIAQAFGMDFSGKAFFWIMLFLIILAFTLLIFFKMGSHLIS